MKPDASFPTQLQRLAKLVTIGAAGWTLGLCTALVGCIAYGCTFGRARWWIHSTLTRGLCLVMLRITRVKLVVDNRARLPDEPCIFISNHTTALDIFATAALALPRTRYFLSTVTLVYLPMTILALLGGVFYLPLQVEQAARRRVFTRAASVLRRTGDSVFLTPEGSRIVTGSVARFNKGAFHMALDLERPIVFMYTELQDKSGNRVYDLWSEGAIIITFFHLERVNGPATPDRIEALRERSESIYRSYERGSTAQVA